MQAKELLDAGRLTAAIEQLGQEVKARPADTQRRTFLFELLCFAGEYDRAKRQLDGLALGAGQRIFLMDDEERAMLEARLIEFEPAGNGG